MKNINKKLLTAAIAGVVLAGASAAQAAPPNPSNGYSSVHDNILDKGANFGRCNAVGILAAKVCDTGSTLNPPIALVMPQCEAAGVDLIDEPAIVPCMEEIPCEISGDC